MLNYFKEFTASAMFLDFFWASLLLFVGQLIRTKMKVLQNLFIPASVVAGFLGMFLGDQFANIIGFSKQVGGYSSVLIILLFAGLLLGHTERKVDIGKRLWQVRETLFNSMTWAFMQFSLAILLGYFLAYTVFPGISEKIGILLPSGFYGGYGYAGAIGGTLEKYGVESGMGIGATFATIGMIVGIVFGMLNINIANRKGYLNFTKTISDIPDEEKNGFLTERNSFSIGNATVNPSSIDPLGWHIAITFVVGGIGWLLEYYIKAGTGFDVPALCLAVVAGFIFQNTMDKIGIGKYIDKKTSTRICSMYADYLVFFGISTIKKSVIAAYWGPILILSLLGIAVNMFYLWFICPKLFHDNWFERGIALFGEFSGVMATGVTLLRIVDSENKSGSLEDLGIATIFVCSWDLFQVGMYPVFIGMGYTLQTGVALGLAFFIMLIIMKVTKCGPQKEQETENELSYGNLTKEVTK